MKKELLDLFDISCLDCAYLKKYDISTQYGTERLYECTNKDSKFYSKQVEREDFLKCNISLNELKIKITYKKIKTCILRFGETKCKSILKKYTLNLLNK